MFEHLSGYHRIFVTGPQRSGTRICAKMIAQDTGHKYIDEREVGIDSIYKLAAVDVEHRNEKLVIQCPALCRYVHSLGLLRTSLIVLMRRNIVDIIASQERIDWGAEPIEKVMYDSSNADKPIAQIKYDFWDTLQVRIIKKSLEIEYESLRDHPLWIPKEERIAFAGNQTERINGNNT